jgi:hypothetical protein
MLNPHSASSAVRLIHSDCLCSPTGPKRPVEKRNFLDIFKLDDLVKNLLERHRGEPRIRSGAGAGIQNILK